MLILIKINDMTYNLKFMRQLLAQAAFLTLSFGSASFGSALAQVPVTDTTRLTDFAKAKTEMVQDSRTVQNMQRLMATMPVIDVAAEPTPDQWVTSDAKRKAGLYQRVNNRLTEKGVSETIKRKKLVEAFDAANIFKAEVKRPYRAQIATFIKDGNKKGLDKVHMLIDVKEENKIKNYLTRMDKYNARQNQSVARPAPRMKINLPAPVEAKRDMTQARYQYGCKAEQPKKFDLDSASAAMPNYWVTNISDLQTTSRRRIEKRSPKFIRDSLEFVRTMRLAGPPAWVKDPESFYAAKTNLAKTESTFDPDVVNGMGCAGYYQFKKGTRDGLASSVGMRFPATAQLATETGQIIQHKFADQYLYDNMNDAQRRDKKRGAEGKESVLNRPWLVPLHMRSKKNVSQCVVVFLTKERIAYNMWRGPKYYTELKEQVDAKSGTGKPLILHAVGRENFHLYALHLRQERRYKKINDAYAAALPANYKIKDGNYEPLPASEIPAFPRTILAKMAVDTIQTKRIANLRDITILDTSRFVMPELATLPLAPNQSVPLRP